MTRPTDASTASPTPTLGWFLAVASLVAREPSLWPTAVRQVARLAPRGWWRRSPRLPMPSPAYFAFRSQTMYGSTTVLPAPVDVCTYLRWCRTFPHERSAATRETRSRRRRLHEQRGNPGDGQKGQR